MHHVIKKQVLDIITQSSEGAFELQESLNKFFYAAILPAIEKTFDELSPGDQLIYFDRMEIDLGPILARDIEKEQWSRPLIEKFTRELKDIILRQALKDPGLPEMISVA